VVLVDDFQPSQDEISTWLQTSSTNYNQNSEHNISSNCEKTLKCGEKMTWLVMAPWKVSWAILNIYLGPGSRATPNSELPVSIEKKNKNKLHLN
jgi:hypothetical protein